MRLLIAFLFVLLLSSSCVQKNKVPVAQSAGAAAQHMVKVEEVIQTTNYTYLKVSENGVENWIAVTKQEAAPGEVYYYDKDMEMKNFESKELNRTFETIYFVQELSKEPMIGDVPTPANQGKIASAKAEGISVEPADGVSVADLYAKAGELAGKTIKMKGQVVKVNNEVMDKNWVHIQDGTGGADNFDLTITTQDKVAVGDVVTFEGTIATKKDFGYGYYYDVIMEDAKLLK